MLSEKPSALRSRSRLELIRMIPRESAEIISCKKKMAQTTEDCAFFLSFFQTSQKKKRNGVFFLCSNNHSQVRESLYAGVQELCPQL